MRQAPPYPLFVHLAGRDVLIVGGGAVAARKAQGLLEAGARVMVVSPQFGEALPADRSLKRIRASYRASHMRQKPWVLAFAATNVASVNAQVERDAGRARVLCCRCDEPSRGDFSGGAAGHVGDVVVAVSTSGASPGLAARIRQQAVDSVDPTLARLVTLQKSWRDQIRRSIRNTEERREILQRLAGEEMIETLRRKGAPGAQRLLDRWLKQLSGTGPAGRGGNRHAR